MKGQAVEEPIKKIHKLKADMRRELFELQLNSAAPRKLTSLFKPVNGSYWFNIIENSSNSFIALFTASWIEEPQSIEMQLAKIAKEYLNKIILVKFNVYKSSDLSIKLNLKTLPVVCFIKGGNIIGTFSGSQKDETYLGQINKLIYT